MSCDCNTLVVGEAGPQGAQGLAGTNGTNGTNGVNAFTTLSASFTQPSVSSTVTITVGTNEWMAVGQAIYISQAGFYTVSSLSGTTQATVVLVKTDGISPTATVSSGRKISPSAVATYSAPLSSLTVNGDSALDGSVVINDSGADKDTRIEGDTDTNLFRTDASVDRVGVGIATPETKFHVAGAFKVGTSASGADATFTQAATFNNNQASTGDFSVKSVNFDPVLFVDASTDRVGINTNLPSKLLDVAGSMEANAILVNPGGASSIDGTQYVFKVNGQSSGVPLIVDATNNRVGIKNATPSVELDVTGEAKISGNLTVDTSTLFVDATNNRVGINDTTPSYSLDVTGTANVTGNTTVGGTLDVTGTSNVADVNTTGAVSVGGNLTVDTNVLFASASGNFVGINTTTPVTDASLVVAGGDLVVDTNVLVVDASTNRVGINNSTPSVALDVTGAASISGNLAVDTDTLYVNASGGSVGVRTSTPATALDVDGATQATSYQIEASAGKLTKFYYQTGSSHTLSGLGANASQTFTDTVTGAAVGDFVISSLNTVPATTDFIEDVIFVTKVTATDTVTLTYTNTDASGNANTFTNSLTLRHLVIRAAAS